MDGMLVFVPGGAVRPVTVLEVPPGKTCVSTGELPSAMGKRNFVNQAAHQSDATRMVKRRCAEPIGIAAVRLVGPVTVLCDKVARYREAF